MAVLLPSSSSKSSSSSTTRKASSTQHEHSLSSSSSSKTLRLTLFASLLVVCTVMIVWSSIYSSTTMTSYIKGSSSGSGSGRGLVTTAAVNSNGIRTTTIIPKSILRPCQNESVPAYADAPADQRKSQFREDQKLLSLFSGSTPFCGGRYIEMGALDGIYLSNSHVFHTVYDWTGVLVEASPRNYENLVRNRPNEIATVHAGVCTEERTLHWVEGKVTAVGGFEEFATQSFKDQWWPQQNRDAAQEVLCRPLTSILDDVMHGGGGGGGNKNSTAETAAATTAPARRRLSSSPDEVVVEEPIHFDFFSLDVEGAEYGVLQSLDFSKYSFGIIVVEADGHNQMKNMAVRTLLETNNYIYFDAFKLNWWFYNRNWYEIYKDILH